MRGGWWAGDKGPPHVQLTEEGTRLLVERMVNPRDSEALRRLMAGAPRTEAPTEAGAIPAWRKEPPTVAEVRQRIIHWWYRGLVISGCYEDQDCEWEPVPMRVELRDRWDEEPNAVEVWGTHLEDPLAQMKGEWAPIPRPPEKP